MSDGQIWLDRAVDLAVENVGLDGGPFGAVVVRDGVVIGEGANRVTADLDPTAHAEVVAIRNACRQVGDFALVGATIYASCEPCPLCVGSMFWAGARHIVFGLAASTLGRISTAPGGTAYGFTITAAELAAATTSPMLVDGPHREDDAAQVHDGFWH